MNKGRVPRSIAGNATELAVQLADRKQEIYQPQKKKNLKHLNQLEEV